MKNINKKVITGVAAALLVIAVLFVCIGYVNDRKTDDEQTEQQEEVGFKLNDDGTVTLGNGYTAHGFYAKDGKLIDSGSNVECEGGYIRGWIEFQQNIAGTTEYGLIIMADFIQKEFAVENEKFDCYRFSLSGEDKTRIEVEIPVGDSAYEMEYLIVPEIDAKNFSMDNESEWNNFLATKCVNVNSYRITDKNGNTRIPPLFEQVDTEKLDELDQKATIWFELVKSSNDLKVFDSAKSGSSACLCLGGMRKEVEAYAVVAFCNWKQVEVTKGQPVRCYTSVADRNSYEEIIFPNVKEEAVYQMFAFEMPIESRQIALVSQTFRIKLERMRKNEK